MNKKTFNNVWFIRLISLLFSIFLYIFVSSENAVPLRSIKNQEFASVNITETISNVPVYLGKTDGETFVSGVPETVDVRLTGPKSIINQVSSETLRVETEDLTDMPTGSKSIRYLVMDLPDEIDYQVTPSRTIVQISRRESVKKTIEYEVDPQAIAEGYQVSQVNLKPYEVTLTGTDKIIKEIDRVFINITSQDKQSKNFTGTYAIKIVDKNGNLLDVNANIMDIKAEVVVEPIVGDVSLNIVPQGEHHENFTYTYEFVDQNMVSIQGSADIQSLDVIVDVSSLTSSQTVIGRVDLPEGVELIGNSEIKVHVSLHALEADTQTDSEDQTTSQESDSSEESDQDHQATDSQTTEQTNE
ncbi:CdaR family protein [Ignavigranum ruoffiae]|uniref:CdaR family protein n=1 Tax=Ignavigranum ruoffiae TaxID=89093 RepID=UPI00206B0E31|nr:CdaR family protein [Ignavigranum ruoffiae]UPQ86315.1 CdaR family protein [Ignavigranum ruoffiae]